MKEFTQWMKIFQVLDENKKRWFAAEKAIELGRGGIKMISELTGMSRTTLIKGIAELTENKNLPIERVRNVGGGRKSVLQTNKELVSAIEKIVGESTVGHPMNALKWTSKTSRNITDELAGKGFGTSHTTVCNILNELEYSLKSNKKFLSTKQDPNRDEQFKYINNVVSRFSRNNQPVISVDTKKKELVGNFKNAGVVWKKKDELDIVYDHDFRSLAQGIAIPYGTYDIKKNEGVVNIGISSDTAEFAVNSIYQWWKICGRKRYPNASCLLICADGGGSNGSRNRLWKTCLQDLANKLKLDITVCHYPPGTSKWNKVEHRMFSFISLNWKGIPLKNYETIIKLISGTTTKTGLKIKANLDKNTYNKGIKIPDEDFDKLNLKYHKKYPKWNYTIKQVLAA
jgi:Rhodopirellula transposase DDE domain